MKKIIIVVAAVAVLAGGAVFGRMAYRSWKQEHLVKQARYFLSKSDVTNAVLCLQGAFQSNPSNVEVCRMFAALAEAGRQPNAISWRRRVAELEPGTTRDRLEWAKTALNFGDLKSADEALQGVGEADRKSAAFVKSTAALAWAQKQFPQAESNYLEAVRLEPTNLVSRLDLAVAQLVSTNPAAADRGRSALVMLATNEEMRCRALRQLTLDAALNQQAQKALSYSTELQNDPRSTFADHLIHLNILNRSKNPLLGDYLASLQKESSTNLIKACELGRWYYSQGRTNEAIVWIHALPPAVQTNLPMPILVAEGRATLGAWTEQEATLKTQNWRDMDYLRHALMARALRAGGNPMAGAVEWQNALKAATKHLETLKDLVRRTAGWGWEPEVAETLWAVMDNFPSDQETFLVLHQRLIAAGDTAGLRNLLAKTYAVVPANADLENNLALISLLLNPQETKAHELAHDVYSKDPKNPFFLSTYAYSLHLQKKSDEALKLFDTLTSQELTNPPVAAYYGIILKGSGNGAKAKPYLELAGGAKLLPEEATLVKKARQGI